MLSVNSMLQLPGSSATPKKNMKTVGIAETLPRLTIGENTSTTDHRRVRRGSSSSCLQVVEAAESFLQVHDGAAVVDEPHQPELVVLHRHELDELLRRLDLAGRRDRRPQPVQRNRHLRHRRSVHPRLNLSQNYYVATRVKAGVYLVVAPFCVVAAAGLVGERGVAAEGDPGGGEVHDPHDRAGGRGEVAGVGLAELLIRRGAEGLPEDPVVAALRQHLGPLRDPPHGRLRDARRCPNCSRSITKEPNQPTLYVLSQEHEFIPVID